jgi:hypothetical protein
VAQTTGRTSAWYSRLFDDNRPETAALSAL